MSIPLPSNQSTIDSRIEETEDPSSSMKKNQFICCKQGAYAVTDHVVLEKTQVVFSGSLPVIHSVSYIDGRMIKGERLDFSSEEYVQALGLLGLKDVTGFYIIKTGQEK